MKTSSDIAKLFVEKRLESATWLDDTNMFTKRNRASTSFYLSAKQFKWLMDVYNREVGNLFDVEREANGSFEHKNKTYNYIVTSFPNKPHGKIEVYYYK